MQQAVQETRLLQTIDHLKQVACKENKASRVRWTLKDLSKPKTWDLANGKTVEVHTPLTTRARELMHLYHGLNLPLLSIEERLDVLLHVKWTVKEFDCTLTREIVDLVRLLLASCSPCHFGRYRPIADAHKLLRRPSCKVASQVEIACVIDQFVHEQEHGRQVMCVLFVGCLYGKHSPVQACVPACSGSVTSVLPLVSFRRAGRWICQNPVVSKSYRVGRTLWMCGLVKSDYLQSTGTCNGP